MRRFFPSRSVAYDEEWESLFGAFFEGKLSGHSIGRIVLGLRRTSIISALPKPSREAYVNPPALFFPTGACLPSPPRRPVASTSTSDSTSGGSRAGCVSIRLGNDHLVYSAKMHFSPLVSVEEALYFPTPRSNDRKQTRRGWSRQEINEYRQTPQTR